MDGDEGRGGIEDNNREQAVPHIGLKMENTKQPTEKQQRKNVYEIENGST